MLYFVIKQQLEAAFAHLRAGIYSAGYWMRLSFERVAWHMWRNDLQLIVLCFLLILAFIYPACQILPYIYKSCASNSPWYQFVLADKFSPYHLLILCCHLTLASKWISRGIYWECSLNIVWKQFINDNTSTFYTAQGCTFKLASDVRGSEGAFGG